MASLTFLLTFNDVVCELDIYFLENVSAPTPIIEVKESNQVFKFGNGILFCQIWHAPFFFNLTLIAICGLNIDYFWKILFWL